MDIASFHSDDNPNGTTAQKRIDSIAAQRPDMTVSRHAIEEAEQVGLYRSMRILVNDFDAFSDPDASAGLTLRVSRKPERPASAPTVDQLRAALAVDELAVR